MQTIKRIKEERIIGYNIDRLLRERNMTEQELADRLSCDIVHVTELMTGSVAVEDEETRKIASVFQVEMHELCEAPEKDVLNYNVHCMGGQVHSEDMSLLLDKIDLYVRLLNQKEEV